MSFSNAKYIRTADNEIIVFPEVIQHVEFKHLNPVSAGFVAFRTKKLQDGYCLPEATCYGESVSLKLKSNPEDSALVNHQILNAHE